MPQPEKLVDIPLSLFAGTASELSPSDCPEGVSPENQDVVFLPGSVGSRPCLHKLFTTSTGVAILYEKTYIQPNGDPLTMLLDANGQIWYEDVGNNPGVKVALATTTPGLYAQSVSALGREYVAFSDLIHGQGVPMQYDGVNWDRVSMDGPGTAPIVSDYIATANISEISNGGAAIGGTPITLAVNSGTASGAITAVSATSTTATYTVPNTFTPGQQVNVNGLTNIALNGLVTVATAAATYFTVEGAYSPLSSVSDSGTATPQNIINTFTTSIAHGLTVGETAWIVGVGVSSYNGQVTVLTIPTAETFTAAAAFTGLANSGGGFVIETVGVTTATAHGLNVGDPFQIAGAQTTGGLFPFDNNVNGNPASWMVYIVVNPTSFIFLPYGWGAQAMALASVQIENNSGVLTIGGMNSPGQYQWVQMFLTRQGYLTKPSPPGIYTSLGGKKVQTSGLAIGPSNVIARVLACTAANGQDFFTILANINLPFVTGFSGAGSVPIVIKWLVVPDNSTTSAIFDFSDTALMGATGIDIPGNNLFDQTVLGPVAGFFTYASRLCAWGECNKINNFLNMGFDGGYIGAATAPTGWSNASNAGGTLVVGGAWASGFTWQITGDGTGNAKGMLTQSAYQDYWGDAILSPSTQYTFRCWAQVSATGLAGNLICDLYSPTAGTLATATIPANTIGTTGGFVSAVFSVKTPASISPDALLRVYAKSLPNGATILADEYETIFTQQPWRDNYSRWSYVNNPEAFDENTGDLGPDDDPSPIRCMSMLKNEVLLRSASGLHVFQDDKTHEPGGWNVAPITRSVGAVSLRAGDSGKFGSGDAADNWDVTLSTDGLYLYSGGEQWKVSQGYQTWFDQINQAAQQTCWVKDDLHNRRVLIGVPLGSATTPSHILAFDYRELMTAATIANSPPIHISWAGKMIASDLTQKWTRWNIPTFCGEIIRRPGNVDKIFVGTSFGNVYWFDPVKLTDDDLGAMDPWYQTYFFVNHDQESALGLGSHRKLVKKICAFVSGVGNIYFTPYADSMNNPLPATSTRVLVADTSSGTALKDDLEWTTSIHGDRISFKIQVAPLAGTTDVQFNLQKLIIGMMPDPMFKHLGGCL
jgi:hypothetical protein